MNKEKIYQQIKQWAVQFFPDDSYKILLEDKESGIITYVGNFVTVLTTPKIKKYYTGEKRTYNFKLNCYIKDKKAKVELTDLNAKAEIIGSDDHPEIFFIDSPISDGTEEYAKRNWKKESEQKTYLEASSKDFSESEERLHRILLSIEEYLQSHKDKMDF